MATAIRPIGHEDRLSLVDHLTELRTRLIISAAALALAFGLCLWQNHELIRIINHPLDVQTTKQVRKGNGPLGQTALAQQGLLGVARSDARLFRALAAQPGLSPALRSAYQQAAATDEAAVARVPSRPTGNKPVTLGVGEPFTTTITVSLYFAFILALPVILFELYGFVLPAFSPTERRIALPLMAAIPILFVIGVLFGYFVVTPAAVRFFQNFNASQFNVLVQASQYYKFIGIILLAMGLVFQVPVGILAATRAGVVTPRQLAKNRRYAIVLCAAVAAFLPGDAITLILETVPLYVLFEASILLAKYFERRDARRVARSSSPTAAGAEPGASSGSPPPPAASAPPAPPDQSVQDIIDHINHHLSD
jgi:sec-independent protein translocase protein TatC